MNKELIPKLLKDLVLNILALIIVMTSDYGILVLPILFYALYPGGIKDYIKTMKALMR